MTNMHSLKARDFFVNIFIMLIFYNEFLMSFDLD